MRHVIAAACLAVAGAVGLAAQAPPAQEQTADKPAAGAAGKAVTVTGCLEAGEKPGTYTLSGVKPDMAAAKGEAAGAEKKMGAGMSLHVMAAGGSPDLKPHVGHTVQLTGNYEGGKGMMTGTTGETSAAGKPGMDHGKHGAMRTFNVTAMKHVAADCKR